VTAPNHHKGLSQPTEKWAAGVPARGSSSGVDNGQGEA
jgi:hypothetical protein